MTQVAPTVDAAFDPSKPKNFEQAMRGVIAAWNDVLKTVAELGGGDLLTKTLGAVKDQIPVEKAALEEIARDFKALGTTIADFVGGVVTDFGKLASIAVSTATTVAGAIAAIGNAAKGGGGTPGFSDPMAGNYGTGGEADSGIQLSPSGVGLDASGNDLPTFATGGSFQVGGSGGTDSQLVQFKASPWETVTVSGGTGTPSGPDTLQGDSSGSAIAAAASSVASVKQITDAIDQSNIDISKQVLTGTDNIVNALNKLIGGVAATTVNPSTGLPVSSHGTRPCGSNAAPAPAVAAAAC